MPRRALPAALALTALAVLALVLANRGPGRYTVTAQFSDVRGLVSGAQVRLAGVPVGEVQRIWLDRGGWPRAQLSIDDDVRLRTGASAAVRLSSLSAEWGAYVSVVPGSGRVLPGGAYLPRRRTRSPLGVDTALATFDPATRRDLRTILAGLRASLGGQGPAIAAALPAARDALSELAGLSSAVGADGEQLRTAVASSRTIAATLAQRRTTLAAAVDATAGAMRTLGGRAGTIQATLAGLPQGLDAARGTLTGTRALIAPARRLIAAALPAVAQLPGAASELQAALVGARPALKAASQVITEAPAAAAQARPLLAAAGPLLSVMNPVLRGIGPMLDQLRVRLPDAFSFFANWADFTANYDANGHAARVGIVLPPAPTNVLSPGSNGPGQLAPPYLRTPGALEGQPWYDYAKSFVDGGSAAADANPGSGR